MKIVLNLLVIILLVSFISSCSKESPVVRGTTSGGKNITPPPPPPPPPVDTLGGKEFIFNDLPWTLAGPGFVDETEIWIGIDRRPDLFGNGHPMEVSVMFDTTNYWTVIPKWDYPHIPQNNGFLYGTIYGMALYVESFPKAYGLLGRRASMKIRFL